MMFLCSDCFIIGNADILTEVERDLETDAAHQDLSEHDPVAHETVERMGKGRGSVMLEKEMPDPGEAVTEYRHQDKSPPPMGHQHENQCQQYQATAYKMQPPARGIAVLAEIKGVKIPKTLE
jgi:hypothetical protein